MIEFKDSDNQVTIEYEATIATAQYENLKPRIIMKCKASEVDQALLFLRSRLKEEYKKIKEAKNGATSKRDEPGTL